MAQIKYTWNQKDILNWKLRLPEKALLKALSRAGNESIKAMRAEAKRKVREVSRIKASYLADKAFRLSYPYNMTALHNLVWEIDVSGREVPLGEYPSRQTKRGVSLEVMKGKRKVIAGAFIQPRKNGRKGVFKRPSKERYPMGHKLGPRVSDIVGRKAVVDAIMSRTKLVFERAMDRALTAELANIK